MARLEPLPPGEWPPEMSHALAALRPPAPRHPFPPREGRPKGLNVLGTLAHHPELATAFHTLTGHVLFATTLTPRQRELLVLRVAALRRCDYEWLQHVLIAADAGLSSDEVARVAEGPGAGGWDELDAALVAATDELVGEGTVGDATWAVLARHLDDRQLMDVVFTVGTYDLLAMAFNAFGTGPDDDLVEAVGSAITPFS